MGANGVGRGIGWRQRVRASVTVTMVLLAAARGAHAASLDPPAPGHTVGSAVYELDLTPPGVRLTPGVLSLRAGRVTLRPGVGGPGVYFLPNFSSGPRLCFGGSNPAIAGVGCVFTDNVPVLGVGWHAEVVIHNPNLLAGVGFNAAFGDGWGNLYAGPAFLGPGSTLYVDMHLADGSLPHFSEVGVPQAWVASRVPPLAAPLGLDVSFTVSEGVLLNDGVFPCPLRVATVQGPTPQGSFNCAFRFFSDPSDSWTDGPDDPNLPSLSMMDPNDVIQNPDVFPALVPINGFQCYEVKRRAFQGPTVSLQDQFGVVDAALVQRPERLCAPADVNDGDPAAPTFAEHLMGYNVRRPFSRVSGVTVTDQFGTIEVDVTRIDRLMVPTAKGLNAPPPPLAPGGVDHFQCYRIRRSRGTPPFTRIPGVTVDDQFGSATVTLRRPQRLCVPVNKNDETPGAELHPMGLLCYQTTSAPFPTVPVFVDNQFGQPPPDDTVLIRRTELCAPATTPKFCSAVVNTAKPDMLCAKCPEKPGDIFKDSTKPCQTSANCPALGTFTPKFQIPCAGGGFCEIEGVYDNNCIP